MRTSTIFLAVLILAMTACSGCQPEKEQSSGPSVVIDTASIVLTPKPLTPARPYNWTLDIHVRCEGYQGFAIEFVAESDVYPSTQRLVEFTLAGGHAILHDRQNGGVTDVRRLRVYPADAEGHSNAPAATTMLLERNQDGSFTTDPAQIFYVLPIAGRITRTGPATEILIEAKLDGLYIDGKLAKEFK